MILTACFVSDVVDMACLHGKMKANVHKRMKLLFKADFLCDENFDHSKEKAQNSDFERGPAVHFMVKLK